MGLFVCLCVCVICEVFYYAAWTLCLCLMYMAGIYDLRCMMYHVSCITYHVSCITYHVSCMVLWCTLYDVWRMTYVVHNVCWILWDNFVMPCALCFACCVLCRILCRAMRKCWCMLHTTDSAAVVEAESVSDGSNHREIWQFRGLPCLPVCLSAILICDPFAAQKSVHSCGHSLSGIFKSSVLLSSSLPLPQSSRIPLSFKTRLAYTWCPTCGGRNIGLCPYLAATPSWSKLVRLVLRNQLRMSQRKKER